MKVQQRDKGVEFTGLGLKNVLLLSMLHALGVLKQKRFYRIVRGEQASEPGKRVFMISLLSSW